MASYTEDELIKVASLYGEIIVASRNPALDDSRAPRRAAAINLQGAIRNYKKHTTPEIRARMEEEAPLHFGALYLSDLEKKCRKIIKETERFNP